MGFTELFLILLVVLLFFGAGRLPALGEGLGKAIRGFRDSMRSAPRGEPPPPPPERKELPPGGGGTG
jgi:sec-independent protein translocase protein TatA